MSAPTRTVVVRAPATCANLGPGFDALGLAVDLRDELVVALAPSGLTIEVTGEGAGQVPTDERHLVVRAMRAGFDRLGEQPSGLMLRCTNRIPHGRGLGSSAAAIVSGLLAARALARAPDALGDAALLRLAVDLEGHPDNVTPCLRGGLSLAWREEERAEETVCAVELPVADGLTPVLLIPPYAVSTAAARGLLPATVPLPDAVHNAARSALLVEAVGRRLDLLLPATQDRLHQPYRAPAMPETAELLRRLRADGLPAVVSGAGPSILVLHVDGSIDAVAAAAPPGWRTEPVRLARDGATVEVG